MKRIILLITIALTGCVKDEIVQDRCLECFVAGIELNRVCEEDLINDNITLDEIYNSSNGVYVNMGDTSGVIECQYIN